MDSASTVSQVPVFLQASGSFTSFSRQIAAPWNPHNCYGDLQTSLIMKPTDSDLSASPKNSRGMQQRAPGTHSNIGGNVLDHTEGSDYFQTLMPQRSSDANGLEAGLVQAAASRLSFTETISPRELPQLPQTSKKKKKKAKKPPLKAALNSDLPTMVPPLIDAAEKQHQCPDCPRRFSWQFQLQQHSRTHSGERPFVCPDCQQAYKRREHLQRHQRVHTGERPFQCEVCEKRYRRKSQLIRHARAHTGERPYNCVACEKNFRRRGHLSRHLKVHSPEVLKKAGMNSLEIAKLMQGCEANELEDTSRSSRDGTVYSHQHPSSEIADMLK